MGGDADAAVRRVIAALGDDVDRASDALDVLAAEVSGADLTSFLLEVMRRRADRLTAADVMRRARTDPFVEPGVVDARALHRVIATIVDAIPDPFEFVELSPVVPLGTHSTVATVHQHKVVSTVRNTEVAADPTNALALLAALRRRTGSGVTSHRLAAVQRVLRAQPFGAVGQQHFTVLGVVTAGRDRGDLAFEREALGEQLAALVTATRAVTASPIRIAITNLRHAYTAALVDDVREVVAGAEVTIDPDRTSGRGYYRNLCFKISVDGPDGAIEVGDGGFTDWTRHLTGNRKERLLISGLGIDRLTALIAG